MPVGDSLDQSARAGLTTIRFGGQYVSGDRAFHGSRESLNPAAAANITWHREVCSLEAYHQFNARLGGGVVLPVYDQHIHNRTTGLDSDASGIGDLSFYLLWTPAETDEAHPPEPFFSPKNFSLMAGMSIPTGDELQGEVPALHNYHLGSGSTEFKFSARYDGRVESTVMLSAAATVTIDGGPDSTSFRYGKGYDFNVGATWAPINGVRVVGSLDAVVRDKDNLSTLRLPDTGGDWLFGIVGVMLSPTPRLWIELSASIPIYWHVNGTQPVSNEIWSAGLRYQF
ncbi:MAG: transporter [Planctomycetes bacterium]|nr:transporter [Planctomycetota bacterium]